MRENSARDHAIACRGWWYPQFLVELYESGEINGEELILIGKINSFRECRVSNKWLANWWGKTPRWVSRTLARLRELGLIFIEIEWDESRTIQKRLIHTCFQGDEGYRKSTSRAGEKFHTSGIIHPHQRNNYSMNSIYSSKKVVSGGGPRRPMPPDSFPLNGYDLDREEIITEYSVPVKDYAQLYQGKGWDKIGPKTRKGSHARGGASRPLLIKWERDYRNLCERIEPAKVERVLRWFLIHWDDEFTPTARTFTRFCDRFEDIEKSMRRQNRVNNDDPLDLDNENAGRIRVTTIVRKKKK